MFGLTHFIAGTICHRIQKKKWNMIELLVCRIYTGDQVLFVTGKLRYNHITIAVNWFKWFKFLFVLCIHTCALFFCTRHYCIILYSRVVNFSSCTLYSGISFSQQLLCALFLFVQYTWASFPFLHNRCWHYCQRVKMLYGVCWKNQCWCGMSQYFEINPDM